MHQSSCWWRHWKQDIVLSDENMLRWECPILVCCWLCRSLINGRAGKRTPKWAQEAVERATGVNVSWFFCYLCIVEKGYLALYILMSFSVFKEGQRRWLLCWLDCCHPPRSRKDNDGIPPRAIPVCDRRHYGLGCGEVSTSYVLRTYMVPTLTSTT